MRKVFSVFLVLVACLSFLTLLASLRAPVLELVSILGHVIILVVLIFAAVHFWQPKQR